MVDTREKILQAAKQVFLEKGYSRATVDEIMAQASLGKGTMYLYFESKEDLFVSVVEQAWNSLQQRLDVIILNQNLPAFERMRQGFLEYLAFFEQDPSIIALIVDAERNLRGRIAKGYFSRYYARIPMALQLISQAQEEGKLKKSVNPSEVVEMVLSLANGLIYMWFVQRQSDSLVKKGQQIWEMLWNGIGN